MPPVLVSACLLGVHSRYDGGTRLDAELIRRLEREGWVPVPVCPEQLGGLPTPRPPAGITAGDGQDVLAGNAAVLNAAGVDVTAQYVRGAEEALRIARACGCTRAYLKEGSPACGASVIRRSGNAIAGTGVAAARLRSEGIEVLGEPGGPKVDR